MPSWVTPSPHPSNGEPETSLIHQERRQPGDAPAGRPARSRGLIIGFH